MAKKKAGSVVDTSTYAYATTRIRDEKTGAIRHTKTNGDAVAKAMLVAVASGVSIEKIIRENKLEQKATQYDNQGLLRMSVGNSLRGLVRNGTHVTIGDTVVKSLEQRVAVPEVKDVAPKAKKPAAKKAKKAKKASAPRKRKAALAAESSSGTAAE